MTEYVFRSLKNHQMKTRIHWILETYSLNTVHVFTEYYSGVWIVGSKWIGQVGKWLKLERLSRRSPPSFKPFSKNTSRDCSKNTIRDGGSTALYTACLYTVDIASTNTAHISYTIYTIQTALHCLYILWGKVRTLLEWADGLLSNLMDGVDTP